MNLSKEPKKIEVKKSRKSNSWFQITWDVNVTELIEKKIIKGKKKKYGSWLDEAPKFRLNAVEHPEEDENVSCIREYVNIIIYEYQTIQYYCVLTICENSDWVMKVQKYYKNDCARLANTSLFWLCFDPNWLMILCVESANLV